MIHKTAISQGFDVSKNTSLDQLQSFLANKSGDGKLYAISQGEGYRLYLKPEAKGFFGKIGEGFRELFGINSERRGLARDAIATVLNETRTKLNDDIVSFSNLSSLLSGVSSSILNPEGADAKRAPKISDIASKLNLMSEQLSRTKENSREAWKSKIQDALASAGFPKDNQIIPTEYKKILVGKTFSVDKMVDKYDEVPVLNIKGEVYTPVKLLGAGGLAQVFEYRSGERSVAVKIPATPDGNDTAYLNLKSAIREIEANRSLSETTDGAVNGFVDAFRISYDRLVVVSELAKGGDGESFVGKLKENIKTDENDKTRPISREDGKLAVLTVLKDIGIQLNKMQSQGGRAHLDIKLANSLIDENGKAKLSDLGSSVPIGDVSHSQVFIPDTPYFTAPEICKLGKRIANDTNSDRYIEQKVQSDKESFKENYRKIYSKNESVVDGMIEKVFSQRVDHDRIRSRTEVLDRSGISVNSGKADVWSFGAMVYTALTDKHLLRDRQVGFQSGDSERKDLLAKYMDDNTNLPPNGQKAPALKSNTNGGTEVGSLAPSTGDQALDDFLNFVLDPDPSTRPTMQSVLQHPYLTNGDIGSERSREILKDMVNLKK